MTIATLDEVLVDVLLEYERTFHPDHDAYASALARLAYLVAEDHPEVAHEIIATIQRRESQRLDS